MARDARIGAIGAEPIRQLYWEGKTDEANQRAKELLKANTAGIALASGAASSSLLADLLTTAGTTVIDTIGDGDSKNLAKNVAKNAIGDLLGFGAGKALNHFIDLDIINKAFKDGRLRIGEPTTYTAYHQSDNPITQFTFPYKKRWDVVTHGADPNAAFFTVDNPAASGFLSKRPYTSKFDVTVQKPLIQTGEINGATKNSMRNKIVKRARKLGADGVLFDGIADNQLQNQRILMAFDNSDIKHLSTSITNPSELTDAQWDNLYNKAIVNNDLAEVQRLRDLHFRVKAPNTKVTFPVYHGTPSKKAINTFDLSFVGSRHNNKLPKGFFFTDQRRIADDYALLPESFGTGNPEHGNTISAYVNIENPLYFKQDTKRISDSRFGDFDVPLEKSSDFRNRVRWDNTDEADAIIMRLLDNDPYAVFYESLQNQYLIKDPKKIKLSAPITYDDAGNIIPLSKRDNFTIPDVRYGILPFIGLTSINNE